jgi:hypothetical protein
MRPSKNQAPKLWSLVSGLQLLTSNSGRPAYMGGVSPVLNRLLYRHDLPKYLRLVQISARAYIFTISWEKIKNLSQLHCTENSYIITKAVQIQLQHF